MLTKNIILNRRSHSTQIKNFVLDERINSKIIFSTIYIETMSSLSLSVNKIPISCRPHTSHYCIMLYVYEALKAILRGPQTQTHARNQSKCQAGTEKKGTNDNITKTRHVIEQVKIIFT